MGMWRIVEPLTLYVEGLGGAGGGERGRPVVRVLIGKGDRRGDRHVGERRTSISDGSLSYKEEERNESSSVDSDISVLESARESSSVDVDAFCTAWFGIGRGWRRACSILYQDNLSTIFLRIKVKKFWVSGAEAVDDKW